MSWRKEDLILHSPTPNTNPGSCTFCLRRARDAWMLYQDLGRELPVTALAVEAALLASK